MLGFGIQTVDSRRAGIEGVSHGEADAGQIVRCSVNAFFSDVVQLGFSQAGDKQRIQRVLTDVFHRGVKPWLNAHGLGHVFSFALDGLTQ